MRNSETGIFEENLRNKFRMKNKATQRSLQMEAKILTSLVPSRSQL